MKIAVIGSINMDIVMKVARLPQKGETLTAEEYMTIPGGKGANQAVAASRLGADVSMIGALGTDAFGDALQTHLLDSNINIDGVKRTPQPTGNALITVDGQGDNTILVYPGANHQVTTAFIEQQKSLIREADWVMLQLEIPMESVVYAVQMAKEMGKKVLLNPAPAAALPQEMMPLIDVLTPNETELALLSSTEDLTEGANRLLHQGIKQVVVTLGSKGSVAYTQETTVIAPPYEITAVDTTAAGDAFNAALVVAIGDGKKLADALSFANAAGALAATKMGAQSSLPSLEQVKALIRG